MLQHVSFGLIKGGLVEAFFWLSLFCDIITAYEILLLKIGSKKYKFAFVESTFLFIP